MDQVMFEGKPVDDLNEADYCRFLDHRHKLAKDHYLCKKAERDTELAEERERKRLRKKAEKLREKAEKLLEEADEASRLSYRPLYDWPEDMKKRIDAIEEAGYWAARKAINLG